MMLRRYRLGVRLLLAVSMLSTCLPRAFAQQIELPDLGAKYQPGGWAQDVGSAAATMLQKFAPPNISNIVAALGRSAGCLREAGAATGGVYVSRQDQAAVGIVVLISKTKANASVALRCAVRGVIGGGPGESWSPCSDQADYRTPRDEYRVVYWATKQSVCSDFKNAFSGVPTTGVPTTGVQTNRSPVQQSPMQVGPAVASGVWTGTYLCAQGATGFRLAVSQANNGSAQARFDFNALNGQVGAFTLAGRVSGGTISLAPTRWVVPMSGYQMVGLEGTLSADQRTITGRITNPQCGGFTLTRAQ